MSGESRPGRLLVDRMGVVVTVTFDNPLRRNAVNRQMWSDLIDTLDEVAADAEARVIVLTGAGDRAFVSGADMSEFSASNDVDAEMAEYEHLADTALTKLWRIGKPTVARIRGACYGGGVAVAASCDLRVCDETAAFSIPAARLGVAYGWFPTQRLMYIVGAARTQRLLMTAERIPAEVALQWGFADHLFPADGLDRAVAELCAVLAANAPLSMEAAKHTVHALQAIPDSETLRQIEGLRAACMQSEDHSEGLTAFREKRVPFFRGQ